MTEPQLRVLVPTRDEGENPLRIAAAVREALPSAKLFFLDDAGADAESSATLARAALAPGTFVVRCAERRGKAENLRDAFGEAAAAGDAVVCLDCDIAPPPATLVALGESVRRADLTTAGALALATPRSWVERALVYASVFHHELRRRCRENRPAFCVIGRAFALSPRAVALMAGEDPPPHTEDAFMALRISQAGYEMRFLADDVVRYRAPATLRDHFKQARRFKEGTALMRRAFGETTVATTLSPAGSDVLRAFAATAPRRPIGSLLYVFVTLLTACAKPRAPLSESAGWTMSGSTKSL